MITATNATDFVDLWHLATQALQCHLRWLGLGFGLAAGFCFGAPVAFGRRRVGVAVEFGRWRVGVANVSGDPLAGGWKDCGMVHSRNGVAAGEGVSICCWEPAGVDDI